MMDLMRSAAYGDVRIYFGRRAFEPKLRPWVAVLSYVADVLNLRAEVKWGNAWKAIPSRNPFTRAFSIIRPVSWALRFVAWVLTFILGCGVYVAAFIHELADGAEGEWFRGWTRSP